METIKNYLENIFQVLPRTEEMLRLKADLLNDMESKYIELRQRGKTENEAIGTVIAEFGNIDELLNEIGEGSIEGGASAITLETAREFLSASAKSASLIASGVAIIMIGASIFIGLSGLSNSITIPMLSGNLLTTLSLVLLLLMIIPAIAMFIYSGTLVEKFKFIEEGMFTLTSSTKTILKEEADELKPRGTLATIVGVSLCIFSAALLIALSAFGKNFGILGVSVILVIIAVAVFIFIISGSRTEAYEKLLKTGDYEPKIKHAHKVVGGVAGIFWPLVVCVFLIWGFLFDGWGINWIVFPVSAIFFGGFSALYSSLGRK